MIIDCIKDMKASNTQGYDGISNKMIIKTMSDRLIQVLKDFFNAILCTGVIPENINPYYSNGRVHIYSVQNTHY